MKVGVLVASDRASRGERVDQGGPLVREMLEKAGAEVARVEVVPDDLEMIAEKLVEWADELRLDVVVTTGGTGLGPRDFTPEATLRVVHRQVPGISEHMRLVGLRRTPHALLTRGVAGVRGRTLIVNLPGTPRAAVECLEAVLPALPHAVEVLQGQATDCARMNP